MADNWEGHLVQLNEFVQTVRASQQWMGEAQFLEAFNEDMSYPPTLVPTEALAAVPQGTMGYGVSENNHQQLDYLFTN